MQEQWGVCVSGSAVMSRAELAADPAVCSREQAAFEC